MKNGKFLLKKINFEKNKYFLKKGLTFYLYFAIIVNVPFRKYADVVEWQTRYLEVVVSNARVGSSPVIRTR